MSVCETYWGSHGCDKPRGHKGPHICTCCWDPDDRGEPVPPDYEGCESENTSCVGCPPYYGDDTQFYGSDGEKEQRK